MFEFGDLVRDKITGFEGIVVVKADYASGKAVCALQGTEMHDGVPTDWEWICINQLELVKAGVVGFGAPE